MGRTFKELPPGRRPKWHRPIEVDDDWILYGEIDGPFEEVSADDEAEVDPFEDDLWVRRHEAPQERTPHLLARPQGHRTGHSARPRSTRSDRH